MRNICLTLAYDGTDFHGWQRQPLAPTVQECIEKAIQRVTGTESTLCGSGRTDAGVHAAGQIAHFKTRCPIPCANVVKALNDVLPPTVRVKAGREVAPEFHARYHAKAKTYRYRIFQGPVCPPFLWRFVYHHPFALDHAAMAKAARLLEGKHDFTSFAAGDRQESAFASRSEAGEIKNFEFRTSIPKARNANMVRSIFASRIVRRPKLSMLTYKVRGNGFLHHMVRNIAGTLLEVGQGKLAPDEIVRIINARDRTLAGPTAPAQGLCLMKVEY